MPRLLHHRSAHYLILVLTGAALMLPNLGGPSLWDIDEGLNAEAAREMYESGNWVVPKFNFQLRDAKPALLYWLQVAAYSVFGVNEFAARLPSALAALLAALAVYELGRSMFSPAAGLLAGIALLSSLLVCGAGHFANPDALLLACTGLTFLSFWLGFAPRRAGEPPRRSWFVPFGVACGLGMLAKGPIALALPGLVVLLFLAWQRQLRCLLDRRLLLGAAAFVTIAMPWYALVTAQTHGAFARGFFFNNNVERFLAPMEQHRGPIWYHVAAILAGFAPWSIFVLPTIWYGWRSCLSRPTAGFQPDRGRSVAAHRLLICWLAAYLIFFSFSATKLPNYTLPLYPALALLTARFLDGWRRGEYRPAQLVMGHSILCLFAIGIGTSAMLLLAGGTWTIASLSIRPIAGLAHWAWLGAIPVIGASLAATVWAMGRRGWSVSVCSLTATAFVAGLFGGAAGGLDDVKAPRELVASSGALRRDRDVRLAGFQYLQPSLVFYGQRTVRPLDSEEQVAAFLTCPTPSFVFLPESAWQEMRGRIHVEPVAHHWDAYRNCEIVVISNVHAADLARRN